MNCSNQRWPTPAASAMALTDIGAAITADRTIAI
jgi:hypothetical protein